MPGLANTDTIGGVRQAVTIIAYQSFESNTSSTHNAQAIFQKQFTMQTNARVAGNVNALVYPTIPDDPATIVQGPAQLVPVAHLAPLASASISPLRAQIEQIYQNSTRALHDEIDLLVCGELDVASHGDFAALRSFPGLSTHTTLAGKNCQCFTSFTSSGRGAQSKVVTEGVGYLCVDIGGLCVLFVHVPNAFATNRTATAQFYAGIIQEAGRKGYGAIDLVIGDTNQASADQTRACLDEARGGTGADYANAFAGGAISPVDNYLHTESGTNSAGTKMYDVAVYNRASVTVRRVVYFSQSSSGTTATDHMGIAIDVVRA